MGRIVKKKLAAKLAAKDNDDEKIRRVRKNPEGTQIYSIFGQIESVAGEMMIKEGKAMKIDAEYVPRDVSFNDVGAPVLFAMVIKNRHLMEFENLIRDLRA